MVFNATFNNILVLSCWSVLLVEETGVPGENHRPVASHWQTVSHNVLSSTPRLSGIRTHSVSFSWMSLYQGDKTSLFNCFNNIVPISMEYILFGCNDIGEEFNTLLFKSVLKRAMSTLLPDFLNFSPKLEQMWVKIHLKQQKTRNISEIKGFASNLCLGYSHSSQWR